MNGPDRDDAALVKALGHPMRVRILRLMGGEGSEFTISPKGIAKALDVSLNNVSYHVRRLADLGAIRLVDTEPVRGTFSHLYAFDVTDTWALQALGLDSGEAERRRG